MDDYVIADNRRSTDAILALLNHVRSDHLTQLGPRHVAGEPIQLIVGLTATAVHHVRSRIPADSDLLVIGRTNAIIQKAQQHPEMSERGDVWDRIENADADRKIFLHQLLCGVLLARRGCFGTAVATILRGIRHSNGMLKEPFQSAQRRTTLERRSMAVILLEALMRIGPDLASLPVRTAYDLCRAALDANFEGLTLKKIIRGRIAEVTDQIYCESLLATAKLSNTDEVREARTIHQSKGHECANVLVCLEGRNNQETGSQLDHILRPSDESSEEQRITSVAISRARDRLFLAVPALSAEQEAEAIALDIVVTRLERCETKKAGAQG